MWRALFIALGFFCCLLGVECLLIEKAVLYDREGGETSYGSTKLGRAREVVPPDSGSLEPDVRPVPSPCSTASPFRSE